MIDRRATKFTEKMSMFMLRTAAIGAAVVLLDPKITFVIYGVTYAFGGMGFSPDLKGAVVSLILIGGWTAVKEYWLGSSKGTEKQAEAMTRIAEGSPVAASSVSVTNTKTTLTTGDQNNEPNEKPI